MSAASNGDERSLGQLFASATAELSALVHEEIALAKAEVMRDAKRVAVGSGALIAALTVLCLAVPVLSIAAALGIHALGITLGWSFAIVGGAYVLIAALAGLFGYSRFKKVKKPERSIASAKESAAVLQKARPHARPTAPQDVKALGATVAAPAIESKM